MLLREEPVRVPGGRGMLVFNAGGCGVYRLRYEDELLDAVLVGFDRLVPLERFRVVADTWACTLAGSVPVEQFLGLVRRLGGEKDPSVWTMVTGALGLLDFAVADRDRPALEAFIQSLLGPELERVGWDRQDDDDSEAAVRRGVLIGALGTIGADHSVQAESRERFAVLRQGASLDADSASAILHVVATRAGRQEYDALLAHFRAPSDPIEEQRYLDSLSYVRDLDLVAETCELCLNEIRSQDAPYILRRLLTNRVRGSPGLAVHLRPLGHAPRALSGEFDHADDRDLASLPAGHRRRARALTHSHGVLRCAPVRRPAKVRRPEPRAPGNQRPFRARAQVASRGHSRQSVSFGGRCGSRHRGDDIRARHPGGTS